MYCIICSFLFIFSLLDFTILVDVKVETLVFLLGQRSTQVVTDINGSMQFNLIERFLCYNLVLERF